MEALNSITWPDRNLDLDAQYKHSTHESVGNKIETSLCTRQKQESVTFTGPCYTK